MKDFSNEKMEKVYIEVTSNCNLSCEMCSRNFWENEKIGNMDFSVFEKIINEIKDEKSIKTVFFGGIGEPLMHPNIIDMIKLVKRVGKRAELITNGTLLNDAMILNLKRTWLDQIWVSVDDAHELSFAEKWGGSKYTGVFESIRQMVQKTYIRVGLVFVAKKSNIDKLPAIANFASETNCFDIKVTNLIPYNKQMLDDVLYDSLYYYKLMPKQRRKLLNIDFPAMDITNGVSESFGKIFNTSRITPDRTFSLMGETLKRKENQCKFIEGNNVFIRNDGEVCPCMALLHDNIIYQIDMVRKISHASFGNIKNQTLKQVWLNEKYIDFRNRVRNFTFSPCIYCGGCDMFKENKEDCYDNEFPVCGACLWSQGIIQCP